MLNDLSAACSITNWYSKFSKNTLETTIIHIPNDVARYLKDEAFILPVEATKTTVFDKSAQWSDGTLVQDNATVEDDDLQPTFPEFSRKIQQVLDDYGAVFIKTNWRSPSDATWVSPTKTLKCYTLEDVFLLLKSSSKTSGDINSATEFSVNNRLIPPCLVLKKWIDINPSTEFRCFVINNELIGICQRDSSQYHQYIETEKFNIQNDIKTLFHEKIKNKFDLKDYSFDVIRYKKDKVKIVDFGCLNEATTKGTLFTYSELINSVTNPPEFRFIAEDMGIQPNNSNHFCVPQEISELFSRNNADQSLIEMIRQEVENQRIE